MWDVIIALEVIITILLLAFVIVYNNRNKYKITLTRKIAGVTQTKEHKVWFCWWTFWLGPIGAAIRGNWKEALFVLFIPFYYWYSLFRGNVNNINRLLEEGWVPADAFSKKVVQNIGLNPKEMRRVLGMTY